MGTNFFSVHSLLTQMREDGWFRVHELSYELYGPPDGVKGWNVTAEYDHEGRASLLHVKCLFLSRVYEQTWQRDERTRAERGSVYDRPYMKPQEYNPILVNEMDGEDRTRRATDLIFGPLYDGSWQQRAVAVTPKSAEIANDVGEPNRNPEGNVPYGSGSKPERPVRLSVECTMSRNGEGRKVKMRVYRKRADTKIDYLVISDEFWEPTCAKKFEKMLHKRSERLLRKARALIGAERDV